MRVSASNEMTEVSRTMRRVSGLRADFRVPNGGPRRSRCVGARLRRRNAVAREGRQIR